MREMSASLFMFCQYFRYSSFVVKILCLFCYRILEMRKVFTTLRALVEVMEALSKDADPDRVGRLIKEEVLVLSLLLHKTFKEQLWCFYIYLDICISSS